MRDWSLEATLPKPDEIERLAGLVGPGKQVYLSTLPHVALDQQLETARIVRSLGLEPVPHVAVRYFAHRSALAGYLARVVREASVSRVLVIGGDLDTPRGEYHSSAQLIESGVLAECGIQSIGVAGYPEGHPQIAPDVLETALAAKLEAARAPGIDIHVVTQFCFSAESIIAWVAELRQRWPDVPVKIGLAGPTKAKALLKYAMRCGVKAPLGGFGRKLAMASQLVRAVAPDDLVEEIDAAALDQTGGGGLSAHLFSFGGVERTTRWALEQSDTRAPASERGTG